jgi:hypothetical protein
MKRDLYHPPNPCGHRNTAARRGKLRGDVERIHALLVVEALLFVLWLVFHATVGLVNLIWLVIIVLAGLWLFGVVRGRSAQGDILLVGALRVGPHRTRFS